MPLSRRIVISASRRTDIPAFYLKWFMECIDKGYFEVINPYNRRISIVTAAPEDVHSIVFWSKNFGPFIKENIGKTLRKKGYNLFFNFTINSGISLLEPNVPPLAERLEQLDWLSSNFSPDAIAWRFDPICFFKTGKGKTESNMCDFTMIAKKASECGIPRCITSFMDDYQKIRNRTALMTGFSFIDPPLETKINHILEMKKKLSNLQIDLYTCCEKKLLESLPADSGLKKSSCIPNDLLVRLYGGELSLSRDSGQRIKNGCGCHVSSDIGSYNLHPCYHNCLFCYANPSSGEEFRK